MFNPIIHYEFGVPQKLRNRPKNLGDYWVLKMDTSMFKKLATDYKIENIFFGSYGYFAATTINYIEEVPDKDEIILYNSKLNKDFDRIATITFFITVHWKSPEIKKMFGGNSELTNAAYFTINDKEFRMQKGKDFIDDPDFLKFTNGVTFRCIFHNGSSDDSGDMYELFYGSQYYGTEKGIPAGYFDGLKIEQGNSEIIKLWPIDSKSFIKDLNFTIDFTNFTNNGGVYNIKSIKLGDKTIDINEELTEDVFKKTIPIPSDIKTIKKLGFVIDYFVHYTHLDDINLSSLVFNNISHVLSNNTGEIENVTVRQDAEYKIITITFKNEQSIYNFADTKLNMVSKKNTNQYNKFKIHYGNRNEPNGSQFKLGTDINVVINGDYRLGKIISDNGSEMEIDLVKSYGVDSILTRIDIPFIVTPNSGYIIDLSNPNKNNITYGDVTYVADSTDNKLQNMFNSYVSKPQGSEYWISTWEFRSLKPKLIDFIGEHITIGFDNLIQKIPYTGFASFAPKTQPLVNNGVHPKDIDIYFTHSKRTFINLVGGNAWQDINETMAKVKRGDINGPVADKDLSLKNSRDNLDEKINFITFRMFIRRGKGEFNEEVNEKIIWNGVPLSKDKYKIEKINTQSGYYDFVFTFYGIEPTWREILDNDVSFYFDVVK